MYCNEPMHCKIKADYSILYQIKALKNSKPFCLNTKPRSELTFKTGMFKGFLLPPLLPPSPPYFSPTQPSNIYLILAEVISYMIYSLSCLIEDTFRQLSFSWIPASCDKIISWPTKHWKSQIVGEFLSVRLPNVQCSV